MTADISLVLQYTASTLRRARKTRRRASPPARRRYGAPVRRWLTSLSRKCSKSGSPTAWARRWRTPSGAVSSSTARPAVRRWMPWICRSSRVAAISSSARARSSLPAAASLSNALCVLPSITAAPASWAWVSCSAWAMNSRSTMPPRRFLTCQMVRALRSCAIRRRMSAASASVLCTSRGAVRTPLMTSCRRRQKSGSPRIGRARVSAMCSNVQACSRW